MQLHNMLRFKTAWAEAAGPQHEIVLSTRVRLARNLRGPFPGHIGPHTLKKTLDHAFYAIKLAAVKNAAFFKMSDLDETDREFLVERHLASPLLAAHPAQRGVVVGDDETIAVMVNEEDHLRLAVLLPGRQLHAAHAAVDRLDDGLSAVLDFAFRDDLGYLTACPTNLGTGMRASCLMHLPGLTMTGAVGRLLENLGRAGLIARGLYGEGTRVVGDVFQLSNATGFGRTEREILAALDKSVAAIAARENEARAALSTGAAKIRLEDEVHRSIALLGAARLLPFEECQQHLSRLRLGLAMGWKLPSDLSLVNELTLSTQPAHLDLLAQKELTHRDRDALRASLVRRRLKAC
ncbi:MAG: ATP--guanido phosphotransferase [Elusimicrobia bacterium]|nr:ATP--guanido phosphotransferase [Elusimicrobiota bacterium]